MDIVTLDPTFEAQAAARPLAPALALARGATVGLLDNDKKNVGHFLHFVAEELTRARTACASSSGGARRT